ncbi:CRISPR-associated endoribonuclease Cas6 [Thermoplasma sp. Kam2015]|uniref:CRISPR-associated endoribonuclease Cas6 n=1 Tax=Thermoplasma sp. Kam2015 TaxID=2094122 RepID=UPI000D893AD3|nr:CRISPR-associated endoribonuclease Cas6 [Thermoplasma sp. Kam2015]PYB67557.1 CRISPR-associated endoribonuclease Cas6 [Thermoplasma sp. Kam2015]
MKSAIIKIEKSSGMMIPYEYNYYIALSIYSKLNQYQNKIRPLHIPASFSVFTFSNIISRKVLTGINGLKIDRGFIIFRTLDDTLLDYLKLGLALDPTIRITETTFSVKSVKEINSISFPEEVKFRTLSPALVRDFKNAKLYVSDPRYIEENINNTTTWFLKHKLGISNPSLSIEIETYDRKTVRISSNAGKNSITTSFNLTGRLRGNPDEISMIYYRGIGSKTGLGLGCWEVNNE